MTVRVWTPRVLAAEVLAQIRKHLGTMFKTRGSTWLKVSLTC
jgi:hypothetical protein